MEQIDDIMLEVAGICDRDRVTVGGIASPIAGETNCMETKQKLQRVDR
ncbi:MAG: hypothetical protein MUE44_01265 [Oscillatoriaceae cyanobacterium Prado104]|nr:hypothetical protein [Oscillatoriaceae cyanobacterium Prado104]